LRARSKVGGGGEDGLREVGSGSFMLAAEFKIYWDVRGSNFGEKA
jgi:hypothetical protein